jgi:uncharacterized membrane protein YccC
VADEHDLAPTLDPSVQARALSYSAGRIGVHALRATGGTAGPDEDEAQEARWYRPAVIQASAAHATSSLQTTGRLAAGHVSPRSVLFRNSVRGAAALAVSVFVAQKAGVQHAFWVVLGTLSVLRSNALGTGATILRALAGTAVGIVIGALLILAIGTDEAVAWAVLPVGVLFAAYAPRVISFAAGQAAFTIVVLMLFNLIQPSGWRVGIVRVEDVALGFAVSIAVGLLFWPRGATALMRDSLATAYARAADYVAATVNRLVAGEDSARLDQVAHAARVAADRLDDAFRQYLAERSSKEMDMESVATLVAGATRLRRTGLSLLALTRLADGSALEPECAHALDRDLEAIRSWYRRLGEAIADGRAPPSPDEHHDPGRARVLECVRRAVAAGDEARIKAALGLLWASQHLDNLWRLEAHLAQPAAEVPGPAGGPDPLTGAVRLRRR